MKRYFAAFLGSIALASGAVLMGTQGLASNETSLSNAPNTQTGKSSSKSIYYKSQAQADVALAAFDKDNPSCQLWTNWQKMCSRTGNDGAVWCSTDQNKPVKPSVPFCVAENSIYSTMQIKSHNRFCKEPSNATDTNLCRVWIEDRPFNGLNLFARRHPFCSAWSTAQPREFLCKEGEVGESSCKSLAAKGYKSKYPLACAAIVVPKKCNLNYDGIIKPLSDNLNISDLTYFPFNNPVNGVSCRNWSK